MGASDNVAPHREYVGIMYGHGDSAGRSLLGIVRVSVWNTHLDLKRRQEDGPEP